MLFRSCVKGGAINLGDSPCGCVSGHLTYLVTLTSSLDDHAASHSQPRAQTTRASASWPPLNAASTATESVRPPGRRMSRRRNPLCLKKPGLNPQPNSDFRSTRTLAHRPGRQGPLIHQMKTECLTGNPAYSIRSYWSSLQAGSGRSVGANAPRPARGIDNPRPIVAR